MSQRNLDPRARGPRIVIRETDDYVSHGEERPAPEPPNPWISGLLQPAIVSLLVGCVTWSMAQVIGMFLNGESTTLYWLAPVVMAFIGFRTQRTVMKRFLSSSDALRFRLIELAVLFLIVKAFSILDETIPELIQQVHGWEQDPLTFFDAQTLIAFSVGVIAWWAASLTARDLEAVRDPSLYLGETEPRQRLVTRYFLGGAALLIFAALARVSIGQLVQSGATRVRQPILNVLLYFFLGIIMVGQINLTRLMGIWQREKVTVSKGLRATWIRYTLLFVGLAALIAFLLPTGYTIGILDMISTLAFLISYVATLLYFLILWPLAMLFSLLMGRSPNTTPPDISQPPLTPPPSVTESAGANPWWALARSVIFWVVLILVVYYLVRSYLRDRPELLERLRHFAPWRWAASVLTGLWHWIGNLGRKVQTAVPALMTRLRRSRSATVSPRKKRRGKDLRERLLYIYLTTLDRANEEGVPRRKTETPYEYRDTLAPHLIEGSDAMNQLTEAFVEARYSTHPVTGEQLAAQEANAEQIRRDLERPKTDDD